MIAGEDVIERAYEAAFVPELWPDVLDRVADLSGTDGGLLLVVPPRQSSTDPPTARWTASQRLLPVVTSFFEGGWLAINPRTNRALSLDHAGFINDFGLFTQEEIDRDPFYAWIREQGYGWCVGTAIQTPSGDTLIFDWERRQADGPVDEATIARLDPLRPHLARASLLSSRLGLERARNSAQTLALLGLPAAVLDGQGRALATNDLFEALAPAIVPRSFGGIRFADRSVDVLFSAALDRERAVRGGRATPHTTSLPIRATQDQPAMLVHVVPVLRTARDVFVAAATIVVVTPVCRSRVPSATVVQGLFDLTPAEARVARHLAGGSTLVEIATSSGISAATVRSQLKAVFAKTGVSRQAELVGLLANMQSPLAPTRW